MGFRNSKIHRTQQSLHLPKQILEEILLQLPVKSLLRFRCVSKSWRMLIGSKRFINSHLQNSTKSKRLSHHRIIFRSEEGKPKQCSLQTLFNEPSIGLSSPTNDRMINEGYVVGECNGLVCFRTYKRGLFLFLLWNPATRISYDLPPIDRQIQTCGFGYDAASNAYKVFVVLLDRNGLMGIIYSSKTNSWRTTVGCVQGHRKRGMFACGKIHWLNPRSIDWLDLKSEVFGAMEHPCEIELGKNPWLGEIKGCLSLVCGDHERRELGVWIMKESWLKVKNVPFHLPFANRPFSAQLEIVSEGVVLLIYGSAFVVLSRDQIMVRNEFSSPYEVRPLSFYVESLVSPRPEPLIL